MKLVLAGLVACASAGQFDGLKSNAETRFVREALDWTAALPRDEEPKEPVLQDPKLAPIAPWETPGPLIGTVKLASQLDRHRDLIAKPLGTATRLVSAAGDAAFKSYFMTFARGAEFVIAPLGDLGRLRGEGIDIRIDADTFYNFKVAINILNPVRGSTFKMTPLAGSRGSYQDIKTGAILDAVKARSFVFAADGSEYWLLEGTDVDPATGRLAGTRSFLFIHEAGTETKAWPVAESALPLGEGIAATLGETRLVLVRVDGELRLHQAR